MGLWEQHPQAALPHPWGHKGCFPKVVFGEAPWGLATKWAPVKVHGTQGPHPSLGSCPQPLCPRLQARRGYLLVFAPGMEHAAPTYRRDFSTS